MTPLKEIGECLITHGDTEYFFRPSFINMTRIGEPKDIVQAFYDLHNDEVTPLLQRGIDSYGHIPAWLMGHVQGQQFDKKAISAAISVITACCDSDTTSLTGELIPGKTKRKRRTFVYRPGVMSPFEMVAIAQSLITHGIIGKAKVRKLQRNEGGETTSEFNAFEYINAARSHFAISRSEAEKLTMTEFQMMLSAKYPDQKGLTKEEYDAVADAHLAKQAKRRAKAAKKV